MVFQRMFQTIGRWMMSGALEVLDRNRQLGPQQIREPSPHSQVELLASILEAIKGLQTSTWLGQELLALLAEDLLVEAELRRCGPNFVARHATHVFSQTYEDAAIAEIFRRIGLTSRRFIEIGVEGGEENTTRLLLTLGWHGLWIEGNPSHIERIESNFRTEISNGQLKVRHALVTAEMVQSIVDDTGFGDDIDFMSIDIDQNTSHIWRALKTRPRVACIEYNAHFPPSIAYEVPYQPDRSWDGSNLFGASLKILEEIGHEKRMSLVGCDLMGVNAYFVADECLGDHFAEDRSAEFHYQPPRFRFVRGQKGHRRAPPGGATK
jgi:hypothetical protein